MHVLRLWWAGGTTMLVAVALAMTGTTTMSTQAQDAGVAPVVGVHSGTCANFTAEPAYDLGVMLTIPIQGFDEEGEGRAETVDDEDTDIAEDDLFGDDELFDENDEGFLSDDLDDDGISEIGRDLDDDGVLDENEVLGEDLNEDAALTPDELIVVVSDPTVAMVWKADAADLEADGEELVRQGSYVIAVHESAERYDSVLACGPILDLVEEDQVVVPLLQQGNSGYSGVALFQVDSGEYAAYLFQGAPGAAGGAPTAAGGGDAAAVLGADGVFNEDDEGFLAEDIDGDGTVEIGQDANGDGTLTEDEVLGKDADGNGELTEDELL